MKGRRHAAGPRQGRRRRAASPARRHGAIAVALTALVSLGLVLPLQLAGADPGDDSPSDARSWWRSPRATVTMTETVTATVTATDDRDGHGHRSPDVPVGSGAELDGHELGVAHSHDAHHVDHADPHAHDDSHELGSPTLTTHPHADPDHADPDHTDPDDADPDPDDPHADRSDAPDAHDHDADERPPPSGDRFPTATSAGVPAGWAPDRSVTGDYTVSTAGAVIEDLRITNGSLLVRAPNVTIRRVQVLGGVIDNQTNACFNGLTIEDTSITRGPGQVTRDTDPSAIMVGGYTARNVSIIGVPEGFRVGGDSAGCGPVVIEDSYVHVIPPDVCNDWHGDALQGYDGPAVTVRNTVLRLTASRGCGATAPFFYPSGQGNTHADIDGLVVDGGGYPFRLGTTGTVRNLHIIDNSWGYGPISVACRLLSSWQASVSTLRRRRPARGGASAVVQHQRRLLAWMHRFPASRASPGGKRADPGVAWISPRTRRRARGSRSRCAAGPSRRPLAHHARADRGQVARPTLLAAPHVEPDALGGHRGVPDLAAQPEAVDEHLDGAARGEVRHPRTLAVRLGTPKWNPHRPQTEVAPVPDLRLAPAAAMTTSLAAPRADPGAGAS